jgi:hypothetical protein
MAEQSIDELAAVVRVCRKEGCGRGGKLTRGLCARCYQYWFTHTPKDQRPPIQKPTFWDRVNKQGPVPAHQPELGRCWVWTGNTDNKGYGRLHHDLAHRRAWRETNGPIPDGLWILHRCDNPPCCNPAHLYPGTHAQNMRDMSERGRSGSKRRLVCPQGHVKEGYNLVITRCGDGVSYQCRACRNEASNASQRRRRRERGLAYTYVTQEEREQIMELRRQGLSYKRIGLAVGRSIYAVTRAIKMMEAA